MVFRVAVVEDEDESAKIIVDFIERYAKENCETINIDRFTDGYELTEGYKPQFDVIFLDIQLKKLDGMKTAQFIRRLDKDVILVFVTNMPQFAIQGYSVEAQNYILKPIDYLDISRQLKQAFKKIRGARDQFLFFSTDDGMVRINAAEIKYVESCKHKMQIYAEEQYFTVWSTMTELEKKLSPFGFIRCSKFYIVNLKHVKALNKNEIRIKSDVYIALGKTYKDSFMNAFINYMR